jgi:hypothetical protein
LILSSLPNSPTHAGISFKSERSTRPLGFGVWLSVLASGSVILFRLEGAATMPRIVFVASFVRVAFSWHGIM